MGYQLSMNIYEIDEEATKQAVEKSLRQAREYIVTEYIPLEPKSTRIYEPRFHGQTNVIGSPVENIAIVNVYEPLRRKNHVERMKKAIHRLNEKQQKIIFKKYFEDDDVLDIDVALELGYSDRHYRRVKSSAMYRLGTSLGLIVMKC